MKKIFKLDCVVQDYAWGATDYIPRLLNIENKENKPFAELWMGAHAKAPSIVKSTREALNKAIESNPTEMLGLECAHVFNNKLPYLFKVLSSKKPLSIQSHPNLQQAKLGYQQENEAGIALNDFYRNYKDDNHKPELICALTEFHAMCGFRKADEIIKNFKVCKLDHYLDSFILFTENKDKQSLKLLFSEILNSKGIKKGRLLNGLITNLYYLDDVLTQYWIEEMLELYPNDIGALSPLFLNTFILKPGEAIYLKAGILHAYLRGTGIEIMANSDNVLRGGLTPKNIDVKELLSILDTSMTTPEIQSKNQNDKVINYHIPINEFSLKRINLKGNHTIVNNKPSIALLINGSISICTDKECLNFDKGEVAFIPGSIQEYEISGEGLLFIASTNN
jgi:mannose-6-phosphate isomerase